MNPFKMAQVCCYWTKVVKFHTGRENIKCQTDFLKVSAHQLRADVISK